MKIGRGNITIKIFHFNFIQVNTLVIYDKSKEAIIVDPGNSNAAENELLKQFVDKECLTVKYIVNTHPHIDHVVGNQYCVETFGAPLVASKDGMPIYVESADYGAQFGFTQQHYPTPNIWITEGESITFGEQSWDIIECYGHADGSICLYNKADETIIVGDVLFERNIGRTDLPTGNYELFIRNIKGKLMPLPSQTVVIPGHGDTTTIGEERDENPYLR